MKKTILKDDNGKSLEVNLKDAGSTEDSICLII